MFSNRNKKVNYGTKKPDVLSELEKNAMTQSAIPRGEQGNAELPVRPPAEASAFVASVLSGSKERVSSDPTLDASGETATSLIGAVGPTPAGPAATSVGGAPVVPLIAANQSLVRQLLGDAGSPSAPVLSASSLSRTPFQLGAPLPANTRKARAYSKNSVILIIVVIAALSFGCGIGVGYGISGRHWKDSNTSTVIEGNEVAVQKTTPSKPVESQDSLWNGADAAPVSPAGNLSNPDSLVSKEQNENLGDVGSDDDLQTEFQEPATQARSARSEAKPATIAPGRPLVSSPASPRNSAPINETPGQHTTIAVPPTSIPPLHTPANGSKPVGTEAVGTSGPSSGQGPDQRTALLGLASSQSLRPVIEAPATKPIGAKGTTAPPSVDANASETNVLPTMQPEEIGRPVDASLDHIDPSELIHSVPPVYPEEAKKQRVEGNVELRVVVGTDGAVKSVGLVSGPSSLVPAAMDAAREFRYKPAVLNGQPIETVQTIDMSFKLKN